MPSSLFTTILRYCIFTGDDLGLDGQLVLCQTESLAGIFLGRYLFRFNDALTRGGGAGARTTTAALGAVEETIQSNVPSMGYTITYAIGNTLLIIWGVVIVLLIA